MDFRHVHCETLVPLHSEDATAKTHEINYDFIEFSLKFNSQNTGNTGVGTP